ncbi:MAG TPA: hypothetical protein VJZ68_09725 [Nitrososphaera sp.]|nr:hypothetical protein [Nitrososphaera sp.]
MAKAKAKRKGKKGKQAKLSKGKKKGGAKKKVAAKPRKGAKKKKAAKRKAAPRPRVTRAEPAPVPAFTEIATEEITPSVPETPEEPVMGSTESMGTGESGFTSTDDNSSLSM